MVFRIQRLTEEADAGRGAGAESALRLFPQTGDTLGQNKTRENDKDDRAWEDVASWLLGG